MRWKAALLRENREGAPLAVKQRARTVLVVLLLRVKIGYVGDGVVAHEHAAHQGGEQQPINRHLS